MDSSSRCYRIRVDGHYEQHTSGHRYTCWGCHYGSFRHTSAFYLLPPHSSLLIQLLHHIVPIDIRFGTVGIRIAVAAAAATYGLVIPAVVL